MSFNQEMKHAIQTIQSGGLLVYPTEAVFGLGCDFKNQAAVERLLTLKQRKVSQGLILIASHIQQVLPLLKLSDQNDLARALKVWPGHNTWVFKASEQVPKWISGDFNTVAVRVSSHPVVKTLCDALGQPIVSTSANISGQNTPKEIKLIKQEFGTAVDYYLDLPLGRAQQASSIRLASNGEPLR